MRAAPAEMFGPLVFPDGTSAHGQQHVVQVFVSLKGRCSSYAVMNNRQRD
jgi:hypothetical protein